MLYGVASAHLEIGNSVAISATFSRAASWEALQRTIGHHPIKVIWCHPRNDSDVEVAARLAGRKFGQNCFSNVLTLERYKEVKGRYECPTLPHLDLDTSPPNTVDECVELAINYLRA